MNGPLVGIIMGSDSDLPVMNEAKEILDSFGVANEITIVSAHRTTKRMVSYATTARKRGMEIIIAGAGGAAHLPGMVASLTVVPVIGVPIKTRDLDGLDSLLSVAQMPPGVPVATMAINGARNAGLLACEILGTKYPNIAISVERYKRQLESSVLRKARKLEKSGVTRYIGRA
ncbi:MAG: 5-(carboxyamino)imidazole ribonucleotide mutase [Thermoproteota archaeon]|jgi:5-(carboxyamino)imidazole ribonucleotide mutase|nr:5-(carboxyamino)imidazole ribonucleotide mutase [Thermoproteota archaeon]MDQ5830754.1 5-(carboxyamino)imidazole ribonucleotide mutase [Thermoproteota archaeon]MDQ5859747.1 5-(carboxyamino)imidazole ribonucleotide mutase [Thermoproteota archaeon]MDQ5875274.1 5-(carboxyamino)imidazole ribonucleotide mutase [Thermoproteota archaeon]